MVEIFKSLTGSAGRFATTWFAPTVVAVGLFGFFLLPLVDEDVSGQLNSTAAASDYVLAGLVAFFLAYVLAALTRPVYRFLEGYSPRLPFRPRLLKRHHRIFEELLSEEETTERPSVAYSRVRERIDAYPRSSRNMMPTKLGNVLRASETYGREQYGLDIALLWPQVVGVSPTPAVGAVEASRSALDFFIGICVLGPTFAICSLAVAIHSGEWWALLGLCGMAVAWLSYEGAVAAAHEYGSALRGLAELARKPLADALMVEIPSTIEEERKLWEAISDYAAWGRPWNNSKKWTAQIDAARAAYIDTSARPN